MSLNLKVAQGLLRPEIFTSYIQACQKVLSNNKPSSKRFYSQLPSSQSDASEESEDFFGIPKNYKLQHVRKNKISPPSLKSEVEHEKPTNSNGDEVCDPAATNVDLNMRPVPRKARRLQKNIQESEVATSFGIISFDKQASDVKPLSAEDLTKKAKDVLRRTYLLSSHSQTKKIPLFKNEVSNHQPLQIQPKQKSISKWSQSPSGTPNNEFNILPEVSLKEESTSSTRNNKTISKPLNVPEQNLFEEQYFGNETIDSKTTLTTEKITNRESFTNLNNSHNNISSPSQNLFEEQYFGGIVRPSDESSVETPVVRSEISYSNQSSKAEDSGHLNMDSSFNEVDEQYFRGRSEIGISLQSPSLNELVKIYSESTDKDLQSFSLKGKMTGEIDMMPDSNEKTTAESVAADNLLANTEHSKKPKEILKSDDFVKKWRINKRSVPAALQVEKESQLAYDVAMEIRENLRGNVKEAKEKDTATETFDVSKATESEKSDDQGTKYYGRGKKLDSKGFRILDPNLDLEKMTSADIVRMLKGRILFDHEDFLAIDKPYGLPSISQKNDRVSVSELLPSFAETLPKSFKVSNLHLVQGLDRDVSGAVILAKNPEVAAILRGMYNDSEQIIQRFWAITKGVPSLPSGLIDIPVGEGKVGNIYKMVLRPRYSKEEKILAHTSKGPCKKAVTEYKILSKNLQAALLECTLHTNNIKHQVRVHLASGLNTPILGDHKYSHFETLAPQKLHKEMLEKLKIRQAKVRHLALHLYCKSVVLTNYKGRMIFLTTRPPEHFRDSLKALQLQAPK